MLFFHFVLQLVFPVSELRVPCPGYSTFGKLRGLMECYGDPAWSIWFCRRNMRIISCKPLASFGKALGTERKQNFLQKSMSSFHETLERSRFSFWQNW